MAAGIQSKLLRSIIVLSLFYGTIAIVAFMLMGPETLTRWLDIHHVEADEAVTPFTLLHVSFEAIMQRFNAVMPWLVGGIISGIASMWLLVSVQRTAYHARGKESAKRFRGIGATLSTPPTMPEPDESDLKIKLPQKLFQAHHRRLLLHILSYLGAHQDAFVGDGHGQSLLQHTTNVIHKALEYEDADPLLPLAAAAHDIGKVTSHVKSGKGWRMVALHDKESAKTLAHFDAWWALGDKERSVLIYAVRYEHDPSTLPYKIPGLEQEDVERTKHLIHQLKDVDGSATADEKEEVLKDIDVEEAALSAFFRALPQMVFQTRGLKGGMAAAGWRQEDRLYILEHRLRDLSMAKMDADQAAALGGEIRQKGHVADYSQALFNKLNEKGWLVTETECRSAPGEAFEDRTVSKDFPLWRITAGNKSFDGVVIIQLPPDLRHYYPKESQYKVTVLGALKIKQEAKRWSLDDQEDGPANKSKNESRQAKKQPKKDESKKKSGKPPAPPTTPDEAPSNFRPATQHKAKTDDNDLVLDDANDIAAIQAEAKNASTAKTQFTPTSKASKEKTANEPKKNSEVTEQSDKKEEIAKSEERIPPVQDELADDSIDFADDDELF